MILFTLGAAMVVGSAVGCIVTYKKPDTERDKLHTCFARAKLYIKNRADDQWVYTYPSVNSHEQFKEHEEYTFTLPIGLDPERIYKYYWVFKQGFGENIDLIGDTSKFTLKVYNSGIHQFDYNLLDIPLDGYRLPIVVGRSREGWEVYDMVDYPHLLVAGETGSGKSTQLRSIISTLILSKHPDELQLYLADMKRSEFHLFRGIEHVQEVVTEVKDLKRVLSFIAEEMQRRGDLCDEHEVSHIDDLPDQLPYIILAIDEVALLKKEKACMAMVEDISSIGRALGVFLIVSMQRPDHQVLDGKLKQNLTARMAFKHADGINSRITIGCEGAEDIKASERGLMLFKLDGIKRVQGPYLDLEEAKKLLGK
ncbi:FtsK/SpoIIIE domain-containing protein [Paenibacillus sp. H1-7]|uniref:FtsK/SpoIIIE domain-containing protein n=1 Tax=Paenibacillus sp. H1-7 TaxID=2282849 RepID=UPI001EF82CBA|nr:FtsK/SpoIIIE domain-containing protein [Paenibacillus sp. H1-7]